MAENGYRDGVLKARAIQLEQERFKEDNYLRVLPSTTVLASNNGWLGATAETTIGTAMDAPRALMFKNHMAGAAERQVQVALKGYTGQGQYQEEVFTLSTASDGRTEGSIPFAHIIGIRPLNSTKGYGTYGSVSLLPTDKYGLQEYCDDDDSILSVRCLSGDNRGTVYSSTAVISTTNFDKTNQTLNLTAIEPAGSTLSIKYLSKLQKRFK